MVMDAKLKETAEAAGADFFGVADLSLAREAILEQGGAAIASYPLAVSVGIALPHAIVDQLPFRAQRSVATNYRHHAYDVINQRLDLLASRLGSLLQAAGHRALPVPASQRVDDERICGAFSHKLAARLAGLGWIGRNCLLVTPEAGPRVRFASVLTDAPLQAAAGPMADGCGECGECVAICPVRCFTGEPFRPTEPRERRYDARKCDRYFTSMRRKVADPAVCGLCLYVCPYGRQRTSPTPATA